MTRAFGILTICVTVAVCATYVVSHFRQESLIFFKDTVIDVGKVCLGQPITADFRLNNPIDEQIAVKGIQVSCDCMEVPKTLIKLDPGGEADIPITIRTDKLVATQMNPFEEHALEQSVLVKLEPETLPGQILTIRATLIPELFIEPKRLILKALNGDEPRQMNWSARAEVRRGMISSEEFAAIKIQSGNSLSIKILERNDRLIRFDVQAGCCEVMNADPFVDIVSTGRRDSNGLDVNEYGGNDSKRNTRVIASIPMTIEDYCNAVSPTSLFRAVNLLQNDEPLKPLTLGGFQLKQVSSPNSQWQITKIELQNKDDTAWLEIQWNGGDEFQCWVKENPKRHMCEARILVNLTKKDVVHRMTQCIPVTYVFSDYSNSKRASEGVQNQIHWIYESPKVILAKDSHIVRVSARLTSNSGDDERTILQRAQRYHAAGEHTQAIPIFTRLINININKNRNYLLALLGRARSFRLTGQYNKALVDYEVLYRLLPLLTSTGLAELLATCPDERIRDGKRAVILAESVLKQLKEKHPKSQAVQEIMCTLAAAHAAAGQFPKAIQWQKRAIELGKDPKWSNHMKERLSLYKAGKIYVEPAKQDKDASVSTPSEETFEAKPQAKEGSEFTLEAS